MNTVVMPKREDALSRLDGELVDLQRTLGKLVQIREKFTSIQVARDIAVLQDASRIQGISEETRKLLLKELQVFKMVLNCLEGEMRCI